MASKKNPKKTPRKAKAKPRETSDRVSSDAGWLMQKARQGWRFAMMRVHPDKLEVSVQGVHAQVSAALASALNQDQTRGRRDGRVRK
jgi:hypothetical protein